MRQKRVASDTPDTERAKLSWNGNFSQPMGMSAFARPAGTAGFDLDCVAFAVESDYFYRVVFELAVGVERAVEYVHYVGHDFEV